MATLELRGLSKRFGSAAALDDINLSVANGEFMVLLGPSGGGKSTLLRLICGLEQPDTGSVTLAGRDITKLAPRERNLGMVFQDYGLYPNMNAFNNIAYGLQARGMASSETELRVLDAAEKLGLSELLQRSVVDLSGGEQQRVALARAMVKDAEAYLFDGPLSNLDPKLRFKARHDILKVHRSKGKPSLYVTHDQDEAFAMGDRIAVMGPGGKIYQVADSETLLERPANLFVAGFVGNPVMNLLSVERSEGQLIAPGVTVPVPGRFGEATPRQLVLGVRPDALTVAEGAGNLEGMVIEVEPLIGELEVRLELPSGTTLLALLPDTIQPPKLNETFRLHPDPERMALFDKISGQAL